MPTRRHTLAALGLAGASVAGLAACSDKPSFNDSPKQEEQKNAKASASITSPTADATDIAAGHEFTFTSKDAVETKFELLDAESKTVAGEMHPDGKGWLPAKPLTWGAAYTAKVLAKGDDNKTFTAETKFTVMAKPSNEVRITSFLPDNREIGTGMPIIFQMTRDIPKDQRAAVQRRMIVKTEPVAEGCWGWYSSRELHWRPKDFWKPGTKIFVDSHVGGMHTGDGFYARANVTFTGTTGRQLIMTVDDTSVPKVMVVTIDGQEAKRIRVSLGKPEWQSSSGVTVIMEKLEHTVFDTTNDPNARERYRADIDWAQRLTHGGEHIHSAPWSVANQGIRNVSHGCVNMSPDDAKWLFDITKQGDPVITMNTGQELKWGDGWTCWTESFENWTKRSAIPYTPSGG